MREHDLIQSVSTPATVDSIAADLGRLGVESGSILIVHSSLSSLGWVCGGAVAVVEALLQAIGENGTLVMPTQTTHLADPSLWENPPVPPDWWPTIRETLPAFDVRKTATRGMGVVVETFRSYPGVVRSNHPHVSLAALGSSAERFMANHPLTDGFGMDSPLARTYDADALILLIGVGHESNSSLHLAERIAHSDSSKTQSNGAPLVVDGQRCWVRFDEPCFPGVDFAVIGEAFGASHDSVRNGPIAAGTAQLMRQRDIVDFGVKWIQANR